MLRAGEEEDAPVVRLGATAPGAGGSLERGFAVWIGRFPVHFRTRHFSEGAPVATCRDGGERQQSICHRGGCLLDDG